MGTPNVMGKISFPMFRGLKHTGQPLNIGEAEKCCKDWLRHIQHRRCPHIVMALASLQDLCVVVELTALDMQELHLVLLLPADCFALVNPDCFVDCFISQVNPFLN